MSDNPGLDSIIQGQLSSLLADPGNLPPEFLDWLPQFLSVNAPQLQNSDLSGGTITPVDGSAHNVDWGVGTLTFNNSQTATDVQTHGLGDTPVILLAYPTVAGCSLGGSADATQVTTDGWFPTAQTTTVTYFWLAIV